MTVIDFLGMLNYLRELRPRMSQKEHFMMYQIRMYILDPQFAWRKIRSKKLVNRILQNIYKLNMNQMTDEHIAVLDGKRLGIHHTTGILISYMQDHQLGVAYVEKYLQTAHEANSFAVCQVVSVFARTASLEIMSRTCEPSLSVYSLYSGDLTCCNGVPFMLLPIWGICLRRTIQVFINHYYHFGFIFIMELNLKRFVSRFIQERPAQNFPHLYIVDKATGPFRKIQQAIDAAEPNSIIKVSEGFYEENLIINKPLRIEPKNAGVDSGKVGVVLLASGGVAVRIKLQESDHECAIAGIKFSHSGNSDNSLKKELLEHEHILNIFEHHENIEQLESEFVNRMSFSKMDNIIVLLERGKATLSNCIISLNYLVKSCNTIIPAVWIEKDGHLHIANSQVKGNENKDTIGVVCKLGTLYAQNCIISNHREGGVLIWGIKDSNSKVIKCLIEGNSIGVHMVGEEFKLKLVNNKILKNRIGVKVGLACEPEISSNMIFENREGIEVNSSFPIISFNRIERNTQNGIVCRSYKKFLCKAIIRKNIGIAANKLNGILVSGQNNKTQILNNHMIGFNEQSGIKVEKEAFPVINANKIYKNFKQGILIQENSNAVVEQNDISRNIQCNIALGGANSHHTILLENTISDSPGIGINVVHSGHLKIIRNDVFRNEDGILLTDSHAHVENNYIYENNGSGLACEKKSNPKVVENFITRNGSVGVLLRHESGMKDSVMHSNIVVSNEIDLGIQQYNKELIQAATLSNTIQGELYYPEGISCQLM